MPPKKNAFSMFVMNYRNEEIKHGKKPTNLQKLYVTLSPLWNVSNYILVYL